MCTTCITVNEKPNVFLSTGVLSKFLYFPVKYQKRRWPWPLSPCQHLVVRRSKEWPQQGYSLHSGIKTAGLPWAMCGKALVSCVVQCISDLWSTVFSKQNWPYKRLTVYPINLIYTGPHFGPYMRFDHTTDDHISDMQCNKDVIDFIMELL